MPHGTKCTVICDSNDGRLFAPIVNKYVTCEYGDFQCAGSEPVEEGETAETQNCGGLNPAIECVADCEELPLSGMIALDGSQKSQFMTNKKPNSLKLNIMVHKELEVNYIEFDPAKDEDGIPTLQVNNTFSSYRMDQSVQWWSDPVEDHCYSNYTMEIDFCTFYDNHYGGLSLTTQTDFNPSTNRYDTLLQYF